MRHFMFGAALALLSVAACPAISAPPPSAYISLEEFLQIRDLTGLAISPNQKWAAVRVSHDELSSNKRIEHWYAVSLSGPPEIKRIADGGEPDWHKNGPAFGPVSLEAPLWSKDSQWIYYRAIRDAQLQVWRAHVADGRTEQVTRDHADVAQLALDPDADELLYSVGATRAAIAQAEQAEYENGVLFDDAFISGEPVVRNHPVNGRMMSYRRTKSGDYDTLLNEQEYRIRVVALQSGQVTDATAEQSTRYRELTRDRVHPMATADTVRSGRNAATVKRQRPDADSNAGEHILLQQSLGSERAEQLCADRACTSLDDRLSLNVNRSLRLVGWWNDSNLVFHKEDFHGQGLHVLTVDPKDLNRHRARRIAFTEGVIAGTSWGYGACLLAANEAICASASPTQAPRLEAIALTSGKRRVLFDPNPRMGPDRLGRAERLIVQTSNKDVTSAYLVLPRDYRAGTRLPLVITDYSCWGFFRPENDVAEHIMAANGIAAVCLNDNGQSHRVDGLLRENGGVIARHEPGMRTSLAFREALLSQLAARGIVDPERVALAGMSAGATQVTYSLSQSSRFAAGIITTASYDDPMNAYLNSNLRRLWQDGAGNPRNPDVYYASVSAALRAEKMAPLLMQVPDREYITNLQLYFSMASQDRPVEMIIYPDEFHVKVQPIHRLTGYTRGGDWIRFWLQGYEDPAPSKQAQYERWRKLRTMARSR